jgi:molybdopterin-guanine dinucleotide biosynthesis protein A
MQTLLPTGNTNLDKLQPVVLCGGQSTRMGMDKGLIKPRDITWVQQSVELLSAITAPVLISVNPQQVSNYKTAIPSGQLIADDPLLIIAGPLHGILSIHLQFPDLDLLVLACDMPMMNQEVLSLLTAQYQHHREFEAFVFRNAEETEPLCAIYTAIGLAKIYGQFKAGGLHKHSMKNMISKLDTCFIAVPPHLAFSFRNINAHSELNGL